MTLAIPFLADLLTNYCVFLIIALGAYVTLSAGQLSLGQGILASCGAYTSGALSVFIGLSPILSIVIAGLTGACVGALLCGLIGWRLRGIYLGIASLALCQALVTLMTNLPWFGGPLGLLEISPITDLPLAISILVVITLVLVRIENSHIGRDFRAVAADPVTAAAVGVDTRLIMLMAWSIGGSVSAIGGALYAHQLGSVRPTDFGVEFSLTILLAPAIGGYRRLWGTFIGAVIVIFGPWLLNVANPVDKKIYYAALLVVLMIWRPEGLLGTYSKKSSIKACS